VSEKASFDAASGAPSWTAMKNYASENASFAFCVVTASVEKNRSMLTGKVIWQRETTHKWPQLAFLAHSEIFSEKIWYRKNAKLFDDQH
jgi:hypothetical protein